MRKAVRREVRAWFEQCQDSPSIITEAAIAKLPQPVQCYLRYTQILGKSPITTVQLRQKGFFKTQIDRPWMPLTAEQYYTTDPPAFLWLGTIKPFPFVSIVGSDRFVNGHGHLLIKLFSLITIGNESGLEVDQGELLRFLGEMAWFPTAWLSDYLEWEADGSEGDPTRSAKVTIKSGSIQASAVLSFNDEGQLIQLTAQRYYQKRLEKWSGRFEEYREIQGFWIPTKCEVTWHLPFGNFSYFRGEIVEIQYNQSI